MYAMYLSLSLSLSLSCCTETPAIRCIFRGDDPRGCDENTHRLIEQRAGRVFTSAPNWYQLSKLISLGWISKRNVSYAGSPSLSLSLSLFLSLSLSLSDACIIFQRRNPDSSRLGIAFGPLFAERETDRVIFGELSSSPAIVRHS